MRTAALYRAHFESGICEIVEEVELEVLGCSVIVAKETSKVTIAAKNFDRIDVSD